MTDPVQRPDRARAAANLRGGGMERRRSFCFLERPTERWTVFLVTYPSSDGRWRGYFSFRTAAQAGEVRTADLFVEDSEGEVDMRARSLGRPLLESLLDSAVHSVERRRGVSAHVRGWFRDVLEERSGQLSLQMGSGAGDPSLSRLRSLYDSYRIDQVMHLIALIGEDEFSDLVERLLDGKEIDFGSRDRLQLAMMVVQELERHLPLPPFEAWVEDYMADPEAYHLYSHRLHREKELP